MSEIAFWIIRSHNMCSYSSCICMLILLNVTSSADELTILSPTNDSIVHAPQISVEGSVTNWHSFPRDPVKLHVNGAPISLQAYSNRPFWRFDNVMLAQGPNVLRITWKDDVKFLLVNVGDRLQKRQSLNVFLKWDNTADQTLSEIAVLTLDRNLSDSELTQFAGLVRQRAQRLLVDIYAGAGILINFVNNPGPDVHTVHIVDKDHERGYFGFTAPAQIQYMGVNVTHVDFGDNQTEDECQVYLKSIYKSLRQSKNTDFTRWHPISSSDKLAIRIEDISHVIAYTCAHELGHNLGLVGYASVLPGGWMCGTSEAGRAGHNGPHVVGRLRALDQMYEESEAHRRFCKGFELMDDGNSVEPGVLTGRRSYHGYPSWGHVNGVNRHYLKMLYGN